MDCPSNLSITNTAVLPAHGAYIEACENAGGKITNPTIQHSCTREDGIEVKTTSWDEGCMPVECTDAEVHDFLDSIHEAVELVLDATLCPTTTTTTTAAASGSARQWEHWNLWSSAFLILGALSYWI
jgi:hypothetical protein